MFKKSHLLVCLGIYLLSSCGDSSKPKSGNVEAGTKNFHINFTPETDAYYLFKLAKDSNLNRDFDVKSYSKTISICCLIGLPQRYPVNFVSEQRSRPFLSSYNAVDPLGWAHDLKNGAFITIQADLGLIVLEYPPHPQTGIRDIKDVIQYSAKDYPDIDSNFYTQLSSIVTRSVNEAVTKHDEVISKTNQESQRRISDK